MKNKEIESDAKQKLDELIHSPIFDNNNKQIRGVKFCQTNLKGLNIRGGLATKEKTFIGFGATLKDGKLSYERIDVVNHKKRKKENNNDFKAFKNDIVFFIKKDRACIGGKLVSFYDDRKEFLCQNSRFPSAVKLQPKVFQQGDSTKAIKIGKAIGIIKLKLDILGNIISYQAIGDVQSEIYSFLKELENGLEGSTSYKSM